ncbi:MAG: DUF541 domain-containing protein [Desulfobacteraceae bacterium]|nr:MAG: DUF541 domain-containing protein [Desulfobacteraceae bacterium]
MKRIFVFSLMVLLFCTQGYAFGQQPPAIAKEIPTLTVSGTGEISAAPDMAVVQLGAVAQNENAADAQKQVNRIVGSILDAVKAEGIAQEKMATAELTLSPVYERISRLPPDQPNLPRIVGYQASNVVRIEIDQMNKIGDVIDAGIRAGANRLEGLFFELRDDTRFRKQALQQAVLNAREKAGGIAETLKLRIVKILEITEEGVRTVRPQFRIQKLDMMAAESTPIQPGRTQVNASVAIRYEIGSTGN